jgi:hypothetical protein
MNRSKTKEFVEFINEYVHNKKIPIKNCFESFNEYNIWLQPEFENALSEQLRYL